MSENWRLQVKNGEIVRDTKSMAIGIVYLKAIRMMLSGRLSLADSNGWVDSNKCSK